MNAANDKVLELSVGAFLDRLADRTPTPGGGSVAALAGSLACAMARMVAAYTQRRSAEAEALAGRLDRADHVFRRLADEDIAAYQALSAAGRQARNDPAAADPNQRQEALVTATLVPLEMAATAVSALEVMDGLTEVANRSLTSDLGVAAVMGLACARAAEYSVRVNLQEMTDATLARKLAREAADLLGHAGDLAASVARFVDRDLQPGSG